MHFDRPLLKLPIRFCNETLAQEVASLPPEAWVEHPQNFAGNAAVPLVSPGGEITHRWAGPMAPTPFLESLPYTMDVMRALDSTWGRSRHMVLAPGSSVPEHVDVHYYWRTHLRIHIPVVTNPDVQFHCGSEAVHMAAGECWLFDSFFPHRVENQGTQDRVHLVLDTVGSGQLSDLINRALGDSAEATTIDPGSVPQTPLNFEQLNAPEVMSPWELSAHIAFLRSWVTDTRRVEEVSPILDRLQMEWAGAWARFGISPAGYETYLAIVRSAEQALAARDNPPIMMRNGRPFLDSLRRYVFMNAIGELAPHSLGVAAPVRQLHASERDRSQ